MTGSIQGTAGSGGGGRALYSGYAVNDANSIAGNNSNSIGIEGNVFGFVPAGGNLDFYRRNNVYVRYKDL